MTRALSKAVHIEENILAHRLMGQWSPQSTTFEELILNPNPEDQISQPYPFFLAYAIEEGFMEKEHPRDWHVEHKWDGMRAQLIVRAGKFFCGVVVKNSSQINFLSSLSSQKFSLMVRL